MWVPDVDAAAAAAASAITSASRGCTTFSSSTCASRKSSCWLMRLICAAAAVFTATSLARRLAGAAAPESMFRAFFCVVLLNVPPVAVLNPPAFLHVRSGVPLLTGRSAVVAGAVFGREDAARPPGVIPDPAYALTSSSAAVGATISPVAPRVLRFSRAARRSCQLRHVLYCDVPMSTLKSPPLPLMETWWYLQMRRTVWRVWWDCMECGKS